MSEMGLVSRVSPVQTALRNCTRDEGRPFEVGNQVLISSHRKLLSSERWPIACAMQHGVLLWVKNRRPADGSYVCFRCRLRTFRRTRSGQLSATSGREQCSKTVFLLDDLVGGHLHDQRHREAECLRRFEIDDEFELRGLLHRKLGGLLTLEDAIDIEGRLAELVV